jgi:hypothetical protein
VSFDLATADCPVCYSTATVVDERCELCDAVFGEDPERNVDLPPTAPSGSSDTPLRFSDVIAELQQVGSLVSSAEGALELEAACSRLQMLLRSLRAQFLTDVVIGTQPKRPVT